MSSLLTSTKRFDTHTHTMASHDSEALPRAMCEAGITQGLAGMSITDHYEGHTFQKYGKQIWDNILDSYRYAQECKAAFAGKLSVFAGVEIGEGIWCKELADGLTHSVPFDVVLASVHVVRHPVFTDAFSRTDFSSVPEKAVNEYMEAYFTDVLETAQTLDYDILSHLTVPLRYMNGKYHRQIPSTRFLAQIDEILQTVISRDKALEINTSGFSSSYREFLPDAAILERYRALGGRKVSIGSDAHVPQNVAVGLTEGLALLKKLGFTQYVYYENRQPVFVPIL